MHSLQTCHIKKTKLRTRINTKGIEIRIQNSELELQFKSLAYRIHTTQLRDIQMLRPLIM